MDSNLPLPYEVEEIEELSYLFVNRDGIKYHIYFNPIFLYYPQFPGTYSFNIEPENRTNETNYDQLRQFVSKKTPPYRLN